MDNSTEECARSFRETISVSRLSDDLVRVQNTLRYSGRLDKDGTVQIFAFRFVCVNTSPYSLIYPTRPILASRSGSRGNTLLFRSATLAPFSTEGHCQAQIKKRLADSPEHTHVSSID